MLKGLENEQLGGVRSTESDIFQACRLHFCYYPWRGFGFVGSRPSGQSVFFLSTVYRYNLLPHAPAYLLAVWLPYLQLVVGCCLLFDWFRPAAFFISAGMVAIFLCAQVAVLLSGNSMSCGCFGPRFDSPVGLTSVITLSVVLVGIILALVEKSSEGVRLG